MPKYESHSAMPKKLKADWVKALRSGKYKQAREVLEGIDAHGNSFNCCLGVLCRIDKVRSKKQLYDFGGYKYTQVFDGQEEDLSGKLLDRFGLSSDDQTYLINLNDGDGQKPQSFKQIAKFIEKNIKVE